MSLIEFSETARRARKLVTLRSDVPIDEAAIGGAHLDYSAQALGEFLWRWELRKVAAKVDDMLRKSSARSTGAQQGGES